MNICFTFYDEYMFFALVVVYEKDAWIYEATQKKTEEIEIC